METVKRAYRKGVVPVGVINGRSGRPAADVIRKRRDEPTWDVQWYNFRTEKWEREGKRLTYRQAYDRVYALAETHPYSKVRVGLLTGRRPTANLNGSSSPKVKADA